MTNVGIRVRPRVQYNALQMELSEAELKPTQQTNPTVLTVANGNIIQAMRQTPNGTILVFKDLEEQGFEARAAVDYLGNGQAIAQNYLGEDLIESAASSWRVAIGEDGRKKAVLEIADDFYKAYLEREIQHSVALISHGYQLTAAQCLEAAKLFQQVSLEKKILVCLCGNPLMYFFIVSLKGRHYLYEDAKNSMEQSKLTNSIAKAIPGMERKVLLDINNGYAILFFLLAAFEQNDITHELMVSMTTDCISQPKEGVLPYKDYINALSAKDLYLARLEEVRLSHILRKHLKHNLI